VRRSLVDHQFADRHLASVYDLWSPFETRGDFRFYLPMVMAASAVADIGCGTGELLRTARLNGHRGRLCGLDPATGMLQVARATRDIEWIQGDVGSVEWDEEFDLIVMSGHAFQVLLDDSQLVQFFERVRAALTASGTLAFETRNPSARAWESWIPDNSVEVVTPTGMAVRMSHEVERPVKGEFVTFTSTFTCPDWKEPQTSKSTLRFLTYDKLNAFIARAGLAVVEQYGDWDKQPLSSSSPEIITIASKAG
jgi:ubiquinone/menaquinone biosynthesis C-methylase UbiE